MYTVAPRSNRSAVSLGFMAFSFRRVRCGGAEQQFDQGFDQLVVLAGRQRGRDGMQQGKVELCERRLRLSFHSGPPWAVVASAKPYRTSDRMARRRAERAIPAARR